MAIRTGLERLIARHAKTWTVFLLGSPSVDEQFRPVPGDTTAATFPAWSVPLSGQKDLGISFSGMGVVDVGDKVMLVAAKTLSFACSVFQPNIELQSPDGVEWNVRTVSNYENGTLLPNCRTAQAEIVAVLITRKRVPA